MYGKTLSLANIQMTRWGSPTATTTTNNNNLKLKQVKKKIEDKVEENTKKNQLKQKKIVSMIVYIFFGVLLFGSSFAIITVKHND